MTATTRRSTGKHRATMGVKAHRSTTKKAAATYVAHVSATDARGSFSDWINRVHYRCEWIVVNRRGKPAAAIVSMQDLELLRRLEDQIDIERAREALGEPGVIPWEKVKAEIGL